MGRLAITPAAFEAIAATLPLGSVEAKPDARGRGNLGTTLAEMPPGDWGFWRIATDLIQVTPARARANAWSALSG